MLPTLTFEVPIGDDWVYEVKYDGFRALLFFDKEFRLLSRNGKSLLDKFPEIANYLHKIKEQLLPYSPFCFDSELVILDNEYKSNFSQMQIRGKLGKKRKMEEAATCLPAQLIVFDLLQYQGKWIHEKKYFERKHLLQQLFKKLDLPLQPEKKSFDLLQFLPYEKEFKKIWENVLLYNGEGVVAKNIHTRWEEGKRSSGWLKYKNWRSVDAFIIAYDKTNGYYDVGVYKDRNILKIGQVLYGFTKEEKNALKVMIEKNKLKVDGEKIYVDPAICLEIKYLQWLDGQLREPHFSSFRFDLHPENCTFEKFMNQSIHLPKVIHITHPEKPLWENPDITKIQYLAFLQEIAPYLLPFLNNRLLTVIRYPHGIFAEPFYQKNCPDYAPDFVKTKKIDEINYIICNDMKTLLWLGNQLAFEFHVPFQTINNIGPDEIVFDLDPPNEKRLDLAIEAACLLKEIFDSLELISFVKTSGNKGLQVYIPIPNQFTFEDTRLFTSFIAHYLITKEPALFTVERLKKKRGGRLYIDYVQHSEGKTIIAPYSPRGHKKATVATPLFWDEVNEKLTMEKFQITNILERIRKKGDPFHNYFQAKNEQNFSAVINFLKK